MKRLITFAPGKTKAVQENAGHKIMHRDWCRSEALELARSYYGLIVIKILVPAQSFESNNLLEVRGAPPSPTIDEPPVCEVKEGCISVFTITPLMRHPYKTSQIAPEVERLLEQSLNPDLDLGMDTCTVKNGPCHLSTGIEHLFVALTAHRMLEEWVKVFGTISFNELIYSPHTTVEGPGGFDLSMGHYHQGKRLRSMHKLLRGKLGRSSWIDEEWSWTSSAEGERAKGQMKALIENYHKFGVFYPFLFLHVCFCVHEYRRMGHVTGKGILIPSFDDKRRTIIVDLRCIHGIQHWEAALSSPCFEVGITNDPADNGAKAFASWGEQRVALKVLDFSEFTAHLLAIHN